MSHPSSMGRVLIVDSDERSLASIRRKLHGSFAVTTTKDPLQALKAIEYQDPFAAVIADYLMPNLNGIELFSRIASIDKNIRRIMLTGYTELQMVIDAINQGKIMAFLTKPVSAATLRSVVADAVLDYNELRNGSLYNMNAAAAPPQQADPPTAPLTIKEKEVLFLLARGLSNEEISLQMGISVGTVKTHVNNLFCKLDVNSRSKVVAKGIDLHLINYKIRN